jgi:hypothetical protein
MDYPNKANYFYMNYMNWIQATPDNLFTSTLNNIYETYMIYRTVIVCNNMYMVNYLYKLLTEEDISTICLKNINNLKDYSTSMNRVMLIQFNQLYHYPELFKQYALEDSYLWILYGLNSLQEQCCLHHMQKLFDKNFYIYVD